MRAKKRITAVSAFWHFFAALRRGQKIKDQFGGLTDLTVPGDLRPAVALLRSVGAKICMAAAFSARIDSILCLPQKNGNLSSRIIAHPFAIYYNKWTKNRP